MHNASEKATLHLLRILEAGDEVSRHVRVVEPDAARVALPGRQRRVHHARAQLGHACGEAENMQSGASLLPTKTNPFLHQFIHQETLHSRSAP